MTTLLSQEGRREPENSTVECNGGLRLGSPPSEENNVTTEKYRSSRDRSQFNGLLLCWGPSLAILPKMVVNTGGAL